MEAKVAFLLGSPVFAHIFCQYRDFIFRKMFERQPREGRVAEIVKNVREMARLDER
jgi:hypothetical protein